MSTLRITVAIQLFVLSAITATPVFSANSLTSVPASALTAPVLQKVGPVPYSPQQASYQAYDTTGNVALAKPGGALTAVASSSLGADIPQYLSIHSTAFLNDGYYGNGSSWIGSTANSWIKIDLGAVVIIDSLAFGRDRLNYFDDRDLGQFTIAVALADDIYANGNSGNDLNEYSTTFQSSLLGYSGLVNGAETVKASFDNVAARYVKITFANSGVAIDEIQISAVSPVPEPETYAMLLAGLGFMGVIARRKKPAA